MPQHEANKPLSEVQREEGFLALVTAQDGALGVAQSRKEVAARFGLSDRQVRRVEQEGLDGNWPPL